MTIKHLRAPTRPPGTADATAFLSIHYTPIADIGSGGMGTVVLARATTGPQAGSFVAIKRLFPHLEQDPEIVDAFLDEVWLVSSLHHANVVEPYDWGRDEQGSYLVMQFVPGDSLRALVRARELSGDALPIPVVVEILAAAAAGLHAAHELKSDKGDPLNLVHRDVSPANVIVGYDGSVKLIDFGVAKATGKLVKTESGLIKGKFGYMSPEQMRGEPLDRRSDVFALGILGWEALTLCRLYSAPNEYDVFRMICDEVPVPPSELRGDVPAALDRVILRCLAKDPARRYASCAELLDDLAPLRAPPGVARLAVATVARASMPERLHWIESVTGAPVPISEAPMAVEPDATMRVESPHALRDRLAGDATEETLAPPGRVPSAPVPVPALKVSTRGLPRAAPDPLDEHTVRERGPASEPPAAPSSARAPSAASSAATPTPTANGGATQTIPVPPVRPRSHPPTPVRAAPAHAAGRSNSGPSLTVPHPTLAGADPVSAARRAESVRTVLLAGALVLVAVIASLIGVWLGRH